MFCYNMVMKNFRFLILIVVFVVVISSLLFFLKSKKNYNASYHSDNELLELEKKYNRKNEGFATATDKKRLSSKKRNYLKNKWGSDRSSDEDDIAGNSDSDNSIINKSKLDSSDSTNDFLRDELALNDGIQLSDSLKNKENSSDKNSSTNSQNKFKSLQELLETIPSRSNDFIVRLDKNIDGLETTVSGREARVSLDLLNSDLFEKGAFSNAAGIWITGLSKYKDPTTYEKLWYDYQNQFIEIPGVGIYFMKEELSDEAFAERKIDILNELIEKKNDDKLYEVLANTLAKSGNMEAAEETIDKWSANNDNVNYDYQMAELYRINGEISDNNETSQEYLQEAARYYEQSGAGYKVALPLAKTYEMLGDINNAIRTLENSYDYGKSKQWKDKVAVQIGEYYTKTGDDYAALNSYESSPAPGFVNKVRKAECHQRLGNTQSAIENYQAAIKTKDNANYIPMISLGVLYSNNGNASETKKMYNKINNRLKDFSKKRRKNIKNSSAYQKIKNAVK